MQLGSENQIEGVEGQSKRGSKEGKNILVQPEKNRLRDARQKEQTLRPGGKGEPSLQPGTQAG